MLETTSLVRDGLYGLSRIILKATSNVYECHVKQDAEEAGEEKSYPSTALGAGSEGSEVG